jgi:prolipoprotein diacylglyceryltransferase
MQFPWQLQIGSFSILAHTILEIVAFFIGFRSFLYLRKKQYDIITGNNRTWILVGAIFGALVGSRLLGAMENFPALVTANNKWIYIYRNRIFVTGITLPASRHYTGMAAFY